MHTIMVLAAGFALLAVFLMIGGANGRHKAALAFIPLWLIGAAANMWFGVNRAGYSYTDEFPIFLLIFGVPALSALAVRQWLAR